MTWIKLEDDFPWHPKIATVGPAGFVMTVGALCYASRYLTDGFIPGAALMTIAPTLEGEMKLELIAERLVDAGLWERVDGGWQIHDYLEHQRPKKDVVEQQEWRPTWTRSRDRARDARASRTRDARDGARATREEVEKEKERNPPVVPPRTGGRKRDKARQEANVKAFAEEHFPQLPADVRFRAVRQAIYYGKAETPAQVAAFIRDHFPELQDQL